MDELTHTQIFFACFVSAATSAMSAYAFSTVDNGQPFEWKKAIKYPFYFGCVGTAFCMFGFDWFGGKAKWYRIIGIASGVGLGVLRVDFIQRVYESVITSLAGRIGGPKDNPPTE